MTGINNLNQAVGFTTTSFASYGGIVVLAGDHGIMWSDGRISVIDYPGAAGTRLFGISNKGDMVGAYSNSNSPFVHAFKVSKGMFTALFPSPLGSDIAIAINSSGQIVGWTQTGGDPQGFQIEADGTVNRVQPASGFSSALPMSINDAGDSVGYSAPGFLHTGFLRSKNIFFSFDAPDAGPQWGRTIPTGLNSEGQIVGKGGLLGSAGADGWSTSCQPPVPTTLTVLSGDGQVAAPGGGFLVPLVVRVARGDGAGAPGVGVNFAVTYGSASVLTSAGRVATGWAQNASVSSEPDGAAYTFLLLGSTPGPVTVSASVTGLPPVQFHAAAIAASTSLTSVSGNGQSAFRGQPLANPLVVKVSGPNGGPPLAGIPITFTAAPGTALLNPPSVLTGSDGTASTSVTMGNTPGTTVITAAISCAVFVCPAGLNTVSFTAATESPNGGPAIALVANAFGDTPVIAPNTWVEIKGLNLAPAGDSRTWLAGDFVNNQLPTQLDGVSVRVNEKSAYVWYISPTQINILTPPDTLPVTVNVQVTSKGVTSSVVTVQAQTQSLSFFELVSAGGQHYVYGRHSDGSLMGPNSLFPGLSTPVKPGEKIYVAATGFGPTDVPVVSGALTQAGNLPQPFPDIKIGGLPAPVSFAGLVGVGTVQINFTVPSNAPDGDLALTATYNGLSIQPKLLITVQH